MTHDPSVAGALADQLASWHPALPDQVVLLREYLAFLGDRGPSAADRDSDGQHLTASCFVLTPDLAKILLCFHRKGRFWVQLGGHIEAADPSVSAAAFREAFEEGGVAVSPVSVRPLDVDRHALSTRFGHCTVHWDVGFAALAPAASSPISSFESEDVGWWPVDALPADVPAGFSDRVERIVDAVLALRQGPTHGSQEPHTATDLPRGL